MKIRKIEKIMSHELVHHTLIGSRHHFDHQHHPRLRRERYWEITVKRHYLVSPLSSSQQRMLVTAAIQKNQPKKPPTTVFGNASAPPQLPSSH